MTGIVIPDGGNIGSTSDTDAISVASNGEVTINQSIKATSIKHTNGTTAITINSDGSLSGKFEGAVKFKQVGKPTSGSPATGKVWIAYAIQHSMYTDSGGYGGFANTTVAILTSGGSWVYKDASSSSSVAPALSDASADGDQHIRTNGYRQTLFTHTIEMDAV